MVIKCSLIPSTLADLPLDDIWVYVIASHNGHENLQLVGAGAAYGTAKSGVGIAGVGTFRPDLIMKVRMAPGPRKLGDLMRFFL